MKLAERIMSDYSKAHALEVAHYACSSKKHFKELMQCFMSNEYRLAQRAAWSVCWAAKQRPDMVAPYIGDLVTVLQRKDVHAAVIRNAVRVLEDMDIPEKYHGEVMNTCFAFIEKPETPIAVKAFSLTVLYRLTNIYPEIGHELQLIIQENWENETPAFRSRGRKILAALKKRK